MEIKPIKTKADHRAALKAVEGLMSARQGTRDGERLGVLPIPSIHLELPKYQMVWGAHMKWHFRQQNPGGLPEDRVRNQDRATSLENEIASIDADLRAGSIGTW